jgi:hypothetical protein
MSTFLFFRTEKKLYIAELITFDRLPRLKENKHYLKEKILRPQYDILFVMILSDIQRVAIF